MPLSRSAKEKTSDRLLDVLGAVDGGRDAAHNEVVNVGPAGNTMHELLLAFRGIAESSGAREESATRATEGCRRATECARRGPQSLETARVELNAQGPQVWRFDSDVNRLARRAARALAAGRSLLPDAVDTCHTKASKRVLQSALLKQYKLNKLKSIAEDK